MNILFIDDDPDDGEVLKNYLNKINPSIQFLQVFDGWDAIMHLQKLTSAALPALIVLDINMRIIDGFEFLKVIKGEEKFRNIPIIVYSTSSKKEDENLSLSLGAVNYFTKPKTTHGMQEVVEIFASYFNTEPLINTTSG